MPQLDVRVAFLSARARKMLEYENDNLIQELIARRGLSVLRAYDLFHELKLFLLYCAQRPGKQEPVPPEIDNILHVFLDREREFADFCATCLGGSVAHVPCDEPVSMHTRADMLERVRGCYGTRFYERLWARGLPACTCAFRPS